MNFRRFALALNGAALENAEVLRRRRSLRESSFTKPMWASLLPPPMRMVRARFLLGGSVLSKCD